MMRCRNIVELFDMNEEELGKIIGLKNAKEFITFIETIAVKEDFK